MSRCIWATVPDGKEEPIGVTSLHKINAYDNSCTSGIIIWDPDWWGQGVASATHIARTYWAACEHNRWIIDSAVRTENEASRKALECVGYTVWGTEPRSTWRGGMWLDTYFLAWLHPERIGVLYPNGLPEMYVDGVAKATVALETARREVTFP